MSHPTLAFINATTVLQDAVIAKIVPAMQRQVSGDFAPLWGKDASIVFVPHGAKPPPGSWWMVFSDTSDQSGALGYHDLTNESLPIGKVFVKTTMADGGLWTVTASHEVLEMLGDPDIVRCVFIQRTGRSGVLYSYEACDAVEADSLGYVIDGVHVSDFVTERWFDAGVAGGKFSFRDNVHRPLELAPDGYISVFNVSRGGGWRQVTNRTAQHEHAFKLLDDPMLATTETRYMKRAKLGSRRERRNLQHDQRIRSTAHD